MQTVGEVLWERLPRSTMARKVTRSDILPRVALRQSYVLTPSETERCIAIGTERNRQNLLHNTVNRRYSRRDDAHVSQQGVIGELAFARLFSIRDDTGDTTCRNVHNDTFDGTLNNNWRVDVKTTVYDNAPLLVTTWKRANPPDCYALMIVDNAGENSHFSPLTPPSVSFRGMVRSDDLFRQENVICKGEHRFYQMPQHLLAPLEVLESRINVEFL